MYAVKTVAESVGTKALNFLAKSKIARVVVASVVNRVLQFVYFFRKKMNKKPTTPASLARASGTASKPPRSKATIDALAFLMGAARASSTYCMSGKIAFAELQRAIVTKVLKRKLKKERAKRLPRRSVGRKIKGLLSRRQEHATSFLLLRPPPDNSTSASFKLRQTDSNAAMLNGRPHGVLLRTDQLSLIQFVKESTGMGTTTKVVLAGGAFLFLGISMLGTMVPGGMAVGLIIAGIVAMLIPLIKKVMEFFSGRQAGGGRSEEEADAAPAGGGDDHSDEDEE